MTDTYSRVKSNLVTILQDADHRVVALSGKWGTGKTYLWRAVATELFGSKKKSEQPIYVSTFGAKTINDLKLRILQNAYLTDASTARTLMKTGGGVVRELLKKFTGYSAEEAALLWLPNLVAGRLIVIDDVERKHKSLDIDEFLGLIDEYSENHKTRFLILLNTDKLTDSAMWDTLHEKVIDVEVILNPSAAECFDIAARGKSCPHIAEIRAATVTLKLNNIRVIERILKTIQRIAGESGIDDVPPARWIPSTVFLTAAHYRAIENAPPFEYMMSFNSFTRALERESTERSPQELEWDTLLEKLGIRFADDYEKVLQEYLTSGLLDVQCLKTQFVQYVRDAANTDASNQRNQFFTTLWWDPHKSTSDLLDMARALLPTVDVMSPGDITDVLDAIEELGDKALTRQFLDKWIESAVTRSEYQQIEERVFASHIRKLNAEVLATLNQMRDRQHPPLTVEQTLERIVKNSGWGERERIALARSTVQDYENVLRQIKDDSLRHFLKEHLGWVRHGAPDESFRNGVDNFLAACRNIVAANSGSRLSGIIVRSFQSNGFADKLTAPVTVVTPLQPIDGDRSADASK